MELAAPPIARRSPQATRRPADCRACGAGRVPVFFTAAGVPANSCLLMAGREEALACPRGDLALAACPRCGFVFNAAFDPALTVYSRQYEETQGYSPTFAAFQRELAASLVRRHGLHRRTIMEIGCGKGEFLTLLCELGENRGIGFDPAYHPERNLRGAGRVEVIADFYSDHYRQVTADFVCCKMTLEHVAEPLQLVSTLRAGIGGRSDVTVFIQVPDASRILADCAFEDVYYEHCNYFTPRSLANLFRRCGFEILSVTTGYGGQYLMLEARPGRTEAGEAGDPRLAGWIAAFARVYRRRRGAWRRRLADWEEKDRQAVLWGSGSKGVAFLSALEPCRAITAAVDINPHRHGFFMPGSGLPILSPAALRQQRPEAVIVMNPIYREEIARELQALQLEPELWTL